MSDYSNIPLGLKIPTQIPLDIKSYIQNEATLINLGVSNSLAYTYVQGTVFYCIEEGTRYEWREVVGAEQGLMTDNFVYSDNIVAFGITYSNKEYNFFRYYDINTYSITDAGTGAGLYKDFTKLGYNTQFNLKSIKVENVGTGTSLVKNVIENTDDITTNIRKVKSSTLDISIVGDDVIINTPSVSEIPLLIVNSAYTGVEELGTASKPFKTIQGALDAYVGIGGKGTIIDPTNPELIGSIIEIYKGAGVYVFTGDLDYKDIKITIKEGTIISSQPIAGWLMNFSLFGTTVTHNPIINIEEGGYLYCNKNGFKLEGGDFAIGTDLNKKLLLSGNAVKTGVVLTGTLESYILFEVDGNNLQYVNGGYPHLEINTFIATTKGRMFVIKGNGNVVNTDNPIYVLTDTSVAITNTYAPIEIHNIGALRINKAFVSFNKTPLVTYNQFVSTYDSALLECIDTIFLGDATYFAYNNSAANTAVIKLDSCKMYVVTTSSFAGTVSGIWNNMILVNNNMPSTNINPLTTTITPSCINTINGKVIETLSIYDSKYSAVSAGLPIGAKFINKKNIASGSFVIGTEYKILTIGTTNFTLIGAASNTVGLYFTASGVGIGDGTASLIKEDIII